MNYHASYYALFMYRIIISFSGQERYRSLAPMYYRGAAAAIVVYDITKKVLLALVTVVQCVDYEPRYYEDIQILLLTIGSMNFI